MKDLMETMPKGRCGYYRFNTASKNILRAYKQAKAGRKRAVDCGPQLRWARE